MSVRATTCRDGASVHMIDDAGKFFRETTECQETHTQQNGKCHGCGCEKVHRQDTGRFAFSVAHKTQRSGLGQACDRRQYKHHTTTPGGFVSGSYRIRGSGFTLLDAPVVRERGHGRKLASGICDDKLRGESLSASSATPGRCVALAILPAGKPQAKKSHISVAGRGSCRGSSYRCWPGWRIWRGCP